MAHELSFSITGNAELALADTGAWHNFGTIVDGAMTAQQAMQIACPWEALKLSLFAHAPCNSPQAALAEKWGDKFFRTDQYGVFRSDTGASLGTVGAGYELIQPQQQFDWVDALLEGSGLHYESAGALKGGSVVFVSARVGSIDVLASGDIYRTYLAFINSFDGSLAAQAYLTGTRIVCMNTLQMSLGNQSNVLRFKHTTGVHKRLDAASSLVQNVVQTEATLKDKLELLARRKIDHKESYDKILSDIFPGESTKTKNIKGEVTSLWQHNDGNQFPDWRWTAYSLYNSVTNYVDHSRATRGDNKDQSRAESAILGSGATLKAKALDTILVLTDGTEVRTTTYHDSPGLPEGTSVLDAILADVS